MSYYDRKNDASNESKNIEYSSGTGIKESNHHKKKIAVSKKIEDEVAKANKKSEEHEKNSVANAIHYVVAFIFATVIFIYTLKLTNTTINMNVRILKRIKSESGSLKQ